MSYESFLEIPPDELDFVFGTNVLAMLHLCQAAVPKMTARHPGQRDRSRRDLDAAGSDELPG